MLSRDELAAMMAAEEKRLKAGSREFMERHGEIMGLIDSMQNKGPCQCGNTGRSSNPTTTKLRG